MTKLLLSDTGPHGAYSGWNDTITVLSSDGLCREVVIPKGVFGDRHHYSRVVERPVDCEPRSLSAKWLACYGDVLPLDEEDVIRVNEFNSK